MSILSLGFLFALQLFGDYRQSEVRCKAPNGQVRRELKYIISRATHKEREKIIMQNDITIYYRVYINGSMSNFKTIEEALAWIKKVWTSNTIKAEITKIQDYTPRIKI